MGQVADAWLECQKRIDDYVDEQAAMRTKQHLLKEDWEFYKQSHFIEQLNSKKALVGETNFTDTMRHLFSSRLNISDCPNCNYRHRCTCDDCSLSHILMCGIMDTPVTDDIHNNQLTLQIDSAPDYLSEIPLPSMSSGSSGSGSSSPFNVQQTEKPRLILADSGSDPAFNSEDEDVAPLSAKLADIYSFNNFDNADIVRSVDGIHSELNGGVENMTLKYEHSLQESSTSSSSSEDDTEEASVDHGAELPRTSEGDMMLGRNGLREGEAKRDGSLSSYTTQQADQGSICCECHVCKQEASDAETRCLPAGHQFRIPENPTHPALHLYPHIHGQIPLHTLPHLPPPLFHPSLYTASSSAQSKALVQNHANKYQVLNTSLQDHIYPSCFGNTPDWKSSKFLSIWGSEVMNDKNWNSSAFLQDVLPGSDMVESTLLEVKPNVLPVISSNEGMVVTDSKKRENVLKKKCLYHFQDAVMDTSKVVMATSSATSSVSCTPTTVQSSNNQFKVSSKRLSSLGQVFHSLSSEDYLPSAAPQNNSTCLALLPSLSPVVLSPNSVPHLQSPDAPSFSEVTATASGFEDPCSDLYSATTAPPSATECLISDPSRSCSDPECEGHHCEDSGVYDHQQYDGEDSQDEDSCSEHSSSTSTSTNQKEGKYCDCCYCEFFGHGGPPAAPTSRNYAEMREKLRLRLTKRKEEQPKKSELISDRESVVDHRKVEDLLQFINSPETKPVKSTRAAKRARHKQKKIKEKAPPETEAAGVQEEPPQQQEGQEHEDEEAQLKNRLQDTQKFQAVKKKKRERTSTGCPKWTQNCQVVMTRDPEPPENTQNELLENTEISSELLSEEACKVEQRPHDACELSSAVSGKDSEPLFATEMPVPSHEPLSLLLDIMHHRSEEKSKQQIGKLFAQELKKPSKGTNIQPKMKSQTQSKIKATDLRPFAISKKEEKKANANNSKQADHAAKFSLGSDAFSPNKQQHSKLVSDHCSEPKCKSKKSKKKKSDKGNSSIDDVFLPKDVDLDSVEMDETEREVEYFKRFCLDSARQTRQRLSVNWSNFNLKKANFAAH
ncbi:protein FAM193A isoform X2 [Sphaerodactylus townsendi]|uniref:protein FAM193A isoform X2 n=1 Tax=Sphaerodactylus townsendi TaxID=933632 RepID=UPI002026FC0C|nr:protein FAM193A isoform X2 [Sphaerodactylus townsendi]